MAAAKPTHLHADILSALDNRATDLHSAKFVKITIADDRVYVNTEHGLAFRAYHVENIIVKDERQVIAPALPSLT